MAATAGDARIAVPAGRLGRRAGAVHLPAQRRAVRWILGEQVEEDRRARARQPQDEERAADFLRADLGMAIAIVRELEAVAQVAEHLAAGRDAAEGIETGLGLQ